MSAAQSPNPSSPESGDDGSTADQGSAGASVWGAMSHEIRTPLMGVLGMLEILGRTPLTDEQRRIIATAEESSVALMRIVDDVLDLAKLESTQVTFDPVPTDLASMLESSTELLANQAAAKGLGITCEADLKLPAVLCDSVRLRQVLLNLGANAVKFTDSGHIALTAELIEATPAFAAVRFTVADSGLGIPQELQDFLFRPFSQLASTAGRGLGGAGLGLAICRNLVEAMGGKITVDSAPRKGTRFHVDISLPIVAGDARVTDMTTPRIDGLTVIAVDGGEPALHIAVRYLEGAGGSVRRVAALTDLPDVCTAYQLSGIEVAAIIVGPGVEPEDMEAATAALQTVSSNAKPPILWLHPRAVGGALAMARRGVRAIRAHPLRRAELLMAVAGARPVVAEADPAPVLTRRAVHAAGPYSDEEAVAAARAEGRVILVAEDNPINQQVLRQQLAILGFDCDVANGGGMALRALGERTYPLLLCDCHMPGIDGFELTRIIRTGERAGTSRLPIIAITANAMPGEEARCKAAGMDDYLAKPIEIRALQSAIERWIDVRHRPAMPEAAAVAVYPHAMSDNPAPINGVVTADVSGAVDLRNLNAVFGNDAARMKAVLEQWCSVIGEAVADLRDALAQARWDAATASVHRIKGSAGIVGAHGLSAAAAALETALRVKDLANIITEGRRVQDLAAVALEEAGASNHAAQSKSA
jgi:CheY-like chemotaxis protein/HPt (histidine-containing phosphotransfer) domain-containing protein